MSCSAKPARPKGILCPDCAVPLRVVKTRGQFNILTRRRYCPQCGKRLTTHERPVSKPAGSG